MTIIGLRINKILNVEKLEIYVVIENKFPND